MNAEAARITAFSRWADVVRRPEERDGHATGQQQAERHHVSAGWRDALWWMGSCYLPASAGPGVGVLAGGVCGRRDCLSGLRALRLRKIDSADPATARFTDCPRVKALMQPKVSELLTIDLYGTFTASKCDFAMIRSDFNLPLKLIPTVVDGNDGQTRRGKAPLESITLVHPVQLVVATYV